MSFTVQDLFEAKPEELRYYSCAEGPRFLLLCMLDDGIKELAQYWPARIQPPYQVEERDYMSPRIITGQDTAARIAHLLGKERLYFRDYPLWTKYGFFNLILYPDLSLNSKVDNRISDIYIYHPYGVEYSGKVVDLK